MTLEPVKVEIALASPEPDILFKTHLEKASF
jgi:hypothetical protein